MCASLECASLQTSESKILHEVVASPVVVMNDEGAACDFVSRHSLCKV